MPNDIVLAVQAKYGSSTRVATARPNGHHQVLIFIHFQVLQFHMHHVGNIKHSKKPWGLSEEVQHGYVTTGVKCVWNVITVDSTLLCGLHRRSSWGALAKQSSNSNTKVSRGQLHSLCEGPTRAMVFAWLVSRCTFSLQNIKMIACSNRFYIAFCLWRGRATQYHVMLSYLLWTPLKWYIYAPQKCNCGHHQGWLEHKSGLAPNTQCKCENKINVTTLQSAAFAPKSEVQRQRASIIVYNHGIVHGSYMFSQQNVVVIYCLCRRRKILQLSAVTMSGS